MPTTIIPINSTDLLEPTSRSNINTNFNALAAAAPVFRGAWTAQTVYALNDVVVDNSLPYGGAWRCTTAHTSSNVFQSQIVLGYWEQWSPRKVVYEIMDYGAKVDGSTDDTTAIQNALNAAGAASGGAVHVPTGYTIVSAQLVIPQYVWLFGDGMFSSHIKLANGSNVASTIANYVSPDGVIANADFIAVRDLYIDANGSNQASGNGHGIYFNTNPTNSTATHDDLFDMHQLIQNVHVRNARGDGVNIHGRSETRLINVHSFNSAGNGFTPSYDTFFESCTAESSGAAGFLIQNSNVQGVNCKAFNSTTAGFYFNSTYACVFANCDAQQNKQQGFYIKSSQNISLAGCMAEENSFNVAGSYAGFDVENSSYCVITGESDNQVSTQYQANALRVYGSSSHNSIILSHAATNGGAIGNALTSDTIALANTNNHIIINGVSVVNLPPTSGSGAPGTTPSSLGQIYADTTGKKIYVATGTSSSGDWTIVN